MASSSSRALTRAMKLLSPKGSTPFSVRFLSSATPPKTSSGSNSKTRSKSPQNGTDSLSGSKSDHGDDTFQSKQCIHGQECQWVNPFFKKGASIPFVVVKGQEAMYARLDLPGIGKEKLRLWFEGTHLYVDGEEEEVKGSDAAVAEGRRKYYGGIKIPGSCYNVEEIEAELKNGVLKVKIPKRRGIINVKVKGPLTLTQLLLFGSAGLCIGF